MTFDASCIDLINHVRVRPVQASRYPFFFFFFQAEDGIRDSSVTGVQTCALPILLRLNAPPFAFEGKRRRVQAEQGIRALRDCVDTLITIPNERLLNFVERATSLGDRKSVV